MLRIVNFRLFIANLQCSKNNKINKSEKNYYTMFLAFETNSAKKSFSILHIFTEIRALFVSRGMLIICTTISIDFNIETNKKRYTSETILKGQWLAVQIFSEKPLS